MPIRTATSEDVPQIAALYCTCFAEPPWHEEHKRSKVENDFIKAIKDPSVIVLVAYEENVVVGVTVGQPLSQRQNINQWLPMGHAVSLYLAELFVQSTHRQQGIARALIQERIQQAKARGHTHAVVGTSAEQHIIIALYLRKGFRILEKPEQVHAEEDGKHVILMGAI
jgi:ribosomal protein S18 acetylase RimI-like enzyme